MKKLAFVFAVLSLSACAPVLTGLATLAGAPASPSAVANKVVLDEKAGIAVETMYTAVVKAGALSFRAGLIAPSANPLVRQAGFCTLVVQGTFQPTDLGSRVNALECKLRRARDLTRSSYDALNADGYDKAARDAVSIGKEILALLGGN